MKKVNAFFQDDDVIGDVHKSCFGAVIRLAGTAAIVFLSLAIIFNPGKFS